MKEEALELEAWEEEERAECEEGECEASREVEASRCRVGTLWNPDWGLTKLGNRGGVTVMTSATAAGCVLGRPKGIAAFTCPFPVAPTRT